jgi:hypothetical protein
MLPSLTTGGTRSNTSQTPFKPCRCFWDCLRPVLVGLWPKVEGSRRFAGGSVAAARETLRLLLRFLQHSRTCVGAHLKKLISLGFATSKESPISRSPLAVTQCRSSFFSDLASSRRLGRSIRSEISRADEPVVSYSWLCIFPFHFLRASELVAKSYGPKCVACGVCPFSARYCRGLGGFFTVASRHGAGSATCVCRFRHYPRPWYAPP